MNKEFTYLNEIAYWLIDNNNFTHAEYNLSGSRYSGKTYSVSEIVSILICLIFKYPRLNIAIYAFRKLNKDINELTKEIYEALINIGLIDQLHFNLKYPNKQAYFSFKSTKSFIRVMGVYANSNDRIPLKGLSRSEIKNFDLAIEWEEEANEFTQAEFQAITFAQGQAKKKLKITTCNPDNIYQYHINYLNERMPFNYEIMKTKGEQIGHIEENGIFKLFHYTNWTINKHNLTQDTINNLEELKELDPIKAKSWYYGVPSILTGAIFARYLDDVKTTLDFEPYYLRAGLDIGMATSATGHPTAASLWFINNQKTKAFKIGEYFHTNANIPGIKPMQFKDSYQLANDIISFYIKESYNYPILIQKRLIVNVDYGNGGQAFIDILNQELKKKQIQWLSFNAVKKENYFLNDRIDFTTAGLIKKILGFNWSKCPHTKKQYSLIQWLPRSKIDNSNNKPQMLDLYDDTWDSDMYALINDMKELMQNIHNPLIFNEKRLNKW